MRKFLRGIIAWILARPENPRYTIIEIEKSLPSGGDVSAIATLKEHPGFISLMNKLRFQRAALKAQLENSRHESIRDVDILVAGIYWTRFIESEVNNALGVLQRKPAQADISEIEAFEKICLAIEGIGSTKPE